MIAYPGISLTNLTRKGQAHFIQRKALTFIESTVSFEEKRAIFACAVARVQSELSQQMHSANPETQAILAVEMAMAGDLLLREFVEKKISEGMTLLEALSQANAHFQASINAGSSDYIRERKQDLDDVICSLICSIKEAPEPDFEISDPFIAIADQFYPSEVIRLSHQNAAGLLATSGSLMSHSTVLANSLKLAYMIVDKPLIQKIQEGDQLLLDGEHHQLIIHPNPSTDKISFTDTHIYAKINVPSQASFWAVLNILDELEDIALSTTNGIGLVRTEYLFYDDLLIPDENRQTEVYQTIARAMYPRSVTFRTFDFGFDKKARWLCDREEIPEQNKKRGISLALANISLVKTQLKALCLAASRGNIRILLPYVQNKKAIQTVRRLLKEIAKESKEEMKEWISKIPLGVMIESRSAIQRSAAWVPWVDFFSLGTNDLLRNERIDQKEKIGSTLLWNRIYSLIQDERMKNIPLEVCGILAENPKAITRFIDWGIKTFVIPWTKSSKLKR